jgi:hypothetical protein
MKMSKELFGELSDAIDGVLSSTSLGAMINYRNNVKFVKDQFISFCWGVFHASKTDYSKFYDAGLYDSHIETALKRILSDFA